MSAIPPLKTGAWVKVGGYTQNPEWNGVTGYLMKPKGDTHWTVHFPALKTEEETGNFKMHVQHLTPFILSVASAVGTLGDGAWVQVHGSGNPTLDGTAGVILNSLGKRWVVFFPALSSKEDQHIYGLPEKKLRPVIPAGLRMPRRTSLVCSQASLEWMKLPEEKPEPGTPWIAYSSSMVTTSSPSSKTTTVSSPNSEASIFQDDLY